MDDYFPASPINFAPPITSNIKTTPTLPAKDWPHAPVHRLSEHGVYMITAGTLYKVRLLNTPAKLDSVEHLLLSFAKKCGWQLEAWAILTNHYHFVARGSANSISMPQFLRELHSISAREINRLDGVEGRVVWYNYWDTRLTYQYSYLARLAYVHRNAVKHGIVQVANQYPWCSAAWFERTATPAQVKTIYSFKSDRGKVQDDF